MKKIRLTEGQVDMLQRISEADNAFNWYLKEMGNLNKEINGLYKRITFSTLAEFIDGDLDISVLKHKLEDIDRRADKLKAKVDSQIKKISDEEWEANYRDLDIKLDDMHHKISLHKYNALHDIISTVEDIVRKNESGEPFSKIFGDIKGLKV